MGVSRLLRYIKVRQGHERFPEVRPQQNVELGRTLLITIYTGYASLLSHVVVSFNTQCPLSALLPGKGGDAAMSGVACGTTLFNAGHVGATSCTMG